MRKTAAKRASIQTPTPAVFLSDVEKTLRITARVAQRLYDLLTPREMQAARGMADGLPNEQIAEEMGICALTFKIHRVHMMHKLGAHTATRVANLVNVVRLAEAAGYNARW